MRAFVFVLLAAMATGCYITGQAGLAASARDPRADAELAGVFHVGMKGTSGSVRGAIGGGLAMGATFGGDSEGYGTGGLAGRIELRRQRLDMEGWTHRLWTAQLYVGLGDWAGGEPAGVPTAPNVSTDVRFFVGPGITYDKGGNVDRFNSFSIGLTVGRLGLEGGDNIWFFGIAGMGTAGWQ